MTIFTGNPGKEIIKSITMENRKKLVFVSWLRHWQVIAVILPLVLLRTAEAAPVLQGRIKIDSLKMALKNHVREDTGKVILLYTLSFECHSIDPIAGIDYGEQALSLATSLDFTKGVIWALLCTGNCYWELPDAPKALDYFIRALVIAEKYDRKQMAAIANNNIGNIYADQNDYDGAIRYYLKALAVNEQLKSSIRVARNLLNIGTIYYEKKEYRMALEFFNRAMDIYREQGEQRGLAITLMNTGNVSLALARYDEAGKQYREAMEVAEAAGEDISLMNACGRLGQLHYLLATDDSTFSGNPPGIKPGGRIHLDSAIVWSNRAYVLGRTIGVTRELIQFTRVISDAYALKGDFNMAYRFLDSNLVFTDSARNEEKDRVIHSHKTRLEMAQKEAEIRVAGVKLEKANTQLLALAGGFLLLLVIAALIYRDRRRSELVLLNILPRKIAARLKNKERPIADRFENAAVIFTDIEGFTTLSTREEPDVVVNFLNDFFTRMDALAGRFGVEKIKTIGDCYMAVSGIPEPVSDSLERAALFAIEARNEMRNFRRPDGNCLGVRIGIDEGRVIAGVIGEKKFSYDLWGDAVNTASRMEAHGLTGEIQVTERVVAKLSDRFVFRERGEIEIKGKGFLRTWILDSQLSQAGS